MEKFLNEEPFTVEEIKAAVRKATVSGSAQPVLCGSALRYVGVQPLLDAVCDYLPCPLDMPPVIAHAADNPEKQVELHCDPKEPLAALVFKVLAEKSVDLYFLRVYSGTLKPNSRVLNAATGHKENLTRIYRMFAKRREQLDLVEAGDIVAVVGPKGVLTGHTLCEPRRPVVLETIEFPETVISVSVEPRSAREREKLLGAMQALERQDPTLEGQRQPGDGSDFALGDG